MNRNEVLIEMLYIVQLQNLGIVERKICAVVVLLEAKDAGDWECILNVAGYHKQTTRKIKIKLIKIENWLFFLNY